MGEKLTKSNVSEKSQSLNFSASQSTLIGDDTLSDNEKLWKYIRDKKNCSNKQKNLLELLSQEVQKPNFDIQVVSCDDNISDNSVNNIKKKAAQDISQAKIDDEDPKIKINGTIGNSESSETSQKVESNIKSKKIISPSKRQLRSSFRKCKNLGRRVLLKEFEKTATQKNQFNPKCNSTPICKHNDPKNNDCTINSDFDGLSPITETASIEVKVKKDKENLNLKEKVGNREKANNKSNDKIFNADFTVIPNTQDQLIDDHLDQNCNKEITIVIPETQERNNEIIDEEENIKNNSKSKSNSAFGKSCYTEKSMEISFSNQSKSQRKIDELAEALMKCQQEISDMQNKFQETNCVNSITPKVQDKKGNTDISPKRMGKIVDSESKIPSKRRTFTVESNVLQNSNNNELSREVLSENCNLSTNCNRETVLGKTIEFDGFSTRNQSGEELNKVMSEKHNLNQKEIPRSTINRVSRIPQMKRNGILASLKCPTPKHKFNNSKELYLSKISSVENLSDKNPSNYNNSEKHKADNTNTSRMNLIIEQLQKSIPMSPVFVMIDNHNNRNNETNKSNMNSVRDEEENLPRPPPEFSDSYKPKKLRINIKKMHIPSGIKQVREKGQSKIDDIDGILTSDDEYYNDDFHSNIKESETKTNKEYIINKENIDGRKRKTNTHQRNCITTEGDTNSLIFNKELSISKNCTTHDLSSKNKSKICIPDNFSVQPVDLRKRKSRKSSLLASFKIKEQNKYLSVKRNSSDENYFRNGKRKPVVLLANIFSETSGYQSFTDIINEAKSKNINKKQKSASKLTEKCSLSAINNEVNTTEKYKTHYSDCLILRDENQQSLKNLSFPAPPSFLLQNGTDSTLDIDAEQHILKNSTFPAPPSFLLQQGDDFTLEIMGPENGFAEELASSNKRNRDRLSRCYKFQLANEKNGYRKRSSSVPLTQNFQNQNEFSEVQSQPGYSQINHKNRFQTGEGEKPREVVIDIPPMQNTFDYVSDYLKHNLEDKQKDLSLLNTSFTQKSFPRTQNDPGDVVCTSSNRSKNFIDDEHQSSAESNYICDQPEVVQKLWKKSIKKKENASKSGKLKNTSKNKRTKQNMDPLKTTYLNLTSSLSTASHNISLNQATDVSRRKLYDKELSESEDLNMEPLNNEPKNLNCDKESSFNNVKQKYAKKKNESNSNKIIFNNIVSSSENSEEDFVFKKPLLPAPKSKQSSKWNKRDSNKKAIENNDLENEIEMSTSPKKLSTKKEKGTQEVDKLLQSLPKRYKEVVNLNINDTISSEVRRSSRKAVPRRVYTYWANKYENVRSLTEYNKILKDIYKADKKSQKNRSEKTKMRKNEEINVDENKNSFQKSEASKKKKNIQAKSVKKSKSVQKNLKINQNNLESADENPASPEYVRGVELQNLTHFSEKQNAQSNKVKEVNGNKNRIQPSGADLIETDSQSQSKEEMLKIVDTLKESFTNFETTIRSKVSKTRVKNVREQKRKSTKSKKKLENPNEIKSNEEVSGEKEIISEVTPDKSIDINVHNCETGSKRSDTGSNSDNYSTKTVSDNLSKPSDMASNYGPTEDFFHWIKRLVSVNNEQNNLELNNNKNSQNPGFERFFAEDTFRMVDINQTQFSEKDGVCYIFYNEIMSRNMGFIKFSPGSKKPKAKSRAYNLHFLLLFGVLEFYNEGESHHSTAGSLIFVPKGSSYRINNNSKDVACLFFIKIMDGDINK
ncbi:inner centromere protein A-like [Condylostylus longicornis]|uniref:inner centromere protein A-like n=1 Tax=Condylostylus longicornis TaxID=2530218 RepID=UPI00244E554A|nr:inner centromere protein A-like [Condylostylus longicornis]